MVDFSALISRIEAAVYENGVQAITGQILQDCLKDVVNTINVQKQDGIYHITVTVDGTSGTPSGSARMDDETYTLELSFSGLKGEVGPAGPQGERGPKGDTGERGVQGPTGATGAQGPIGPVGPQGIQGERGPAGTNGTDGVGITDIVQTTTSEEAYGTNVVTITLSNGTSKSFVVRNGGAGPQGPQGPKGDQGDSGYTGAAGELRVVDNLESTDGTAALSANQGRVLNEEISQLGLKVDDLSTGKYYGYFAKEEDLPEADVDGFAYVGEGPTYTIYNLRGGVWTSSDITVNQSPIGNDEDIDQNEDGKLQFANRTYNAQQPNGMGYKILRKDATFASQVTDTNTIYEIRYAFDLGGTSVTIPAGCVLKFVGGRLSSGTINGTDTEIQAGKGEIFGETIVFSGTWNVPTIFSSWFENIVNVNNIFKLTDLCNDNILNTILVERTGTPYLVEAVETIPGVKGVGWYISGKNIKIDIEGTLQLVTNTFPNYSVITIDDAENITLSGGEIIGDRLTHQDTTHENGHLVIVGDGTNIQIDGLRLSNAIGDGVYVYNDGDGNGSAGNIIIRNLDIRKCRRNGVAVITMPSNLLIDNINCQYIGVEIDGIPGVAGAGCGIDIEPNSGVAGFANLSINNVISDYCVAGVSIAGKDNVILDNGIVSNIICTNMVNAGFTLSKCKTGLFILENIKVDASPLRSIICRDSVLSIRNATVMARVQLEGTTAEVYMYDSSITKKNDETIYGGSQNYVMNIYNSRIIGSIDTNIIFRAENTVITEKVKLYNNYNLHNCTIGEQIYNRDNTTISFRLVGCVVPCITIHNLAKSVIRNCHLRGDITESYRMYLESASDCVVADNMIDIEATSGESNVIGLISVSGAFIFKQNIINNAKSITLFRGAGWKDAYKTNNYYNGINYCNTDAGTTRPSNIGSANRGTMYVDINAGIQKPVFWIGNMWRDSDGFRAGLKVGDTSSRPVATSVGAGYSYFDTELGKMIVSNGTTWVNMDGTALS